MYKSSAGKDTCVCLINILLLKYSFVYLQSFFAERFFELFDQDASGTIELQELMDGLRMLTKGTPAQKLQFLFDVFDADGKSLFLSVCLFLSHTHTHTHTHAHTHRHSQHPCM